MLILERLSFYQKPIISSPITKVVGFLLLLGPILEELGNYNHY